MKDSHVVALGLAAFAAYLAWDTYAKPGTWGKAARKKKLVSDFPIQAADASITCDGSGPCVMRFVDPAILSTIAPPGTTVEPFHKWLARAYAEKQHVFIKDVSDATPRYLLMKAAADPENNVPPDYEELILS